MLLVVLGQTEVVRAGQATIVADDLRNGVSHVRASADAAAACSTSGEQKIAIILVSFPSKPLLSSITPEMLQKTYFGPGPSVDSYLRESSYGKAWVTGQVFGPVVLDADYFDQPTAVRDAAIRAAANLVNIADYNRIALVVPQSSTGLESGGLGTIGCSSVPLATSGSVIASTTWLGDVSMGSAGDALAAATHELGHNLGLDHARAADFGSEPLGPVGQLPAPWDGLREYGDSFSNMGRDSWHWAAPHKSFLGWLNNGTDVQTVESNGTFVIQPYENATSGLKAIKVRRGTGNNAWLWIEYRQPDGLYDSNQNLNDGSATKVAADGGAMIHYEDAGWNDQTVHTYLLRFNPDLNSGLFFGQAPLNAGSSWTDPYSNLTIHVTQATPAGLSVTVSYAPPPVCPGSLSPATVNIASVGGPGNLNVIAPSSCSWTASPSVPWITIGSGAGTGNGPVTFSVSANTGTAFRWGRIVVGSTTFVVTEDGLAGNATIAPVSANFTAAGGVGQLAVSTNAADFAWVYGSNADWLQSLSFSKQDSVGPGTLSLIVAQNTDSTPRTGTLTVAGQTFTVTQAAGTATVSQVVWQDLAVVDAPISRLCMDMAVFTARGEAVLYGGAADTTSFTDTWVWDGSKWIQRNPVHNPGNQCGHAMAYDAVHQQVILFGGFTATDVSSDTWMWDGVDWTQLHPKHSPPARANHVMAYNPVSQKIMLFGGWPDDLNDTWQWDGSDWTQLNTPVAPHGRELASMAFDAARGEMVLFGGAEQVYSGQPMFFSDTWIWDGSTWQQRTTAASPSPRWSQRMEYDPDLDQIVLVGGYGAKDISVTGWAIDLHEETWSWNGANWMQRFPDASPEFSYSYGMIYDSVHHAFVVHLGDDLHCATRGPKTYLLTLGPGEVLLAPYSAAIPVSGGKGALAINASVAWTATSSDPWITLTGSPSGTGNATIGYQIAANPATAMRKGNIFIGDQAFSISQEAFGPGISTYSVANDGGVSWSTAGDPVATATGYARIQASAGSTTPSGLAILGLTQSGVLVSEASVPATPAVTSARIYAEISGAVDTGIAIANTNSQAASISFYFTDASGANFNSGTTTVAANGQISAFLDQSPFGNSGQKTILANARSFTITSSVPVFVIAIRGFTNERSEFLTTTLPVTPLPAPASTSVVFPHFADGGGWGTEVVLVNPGDSTLSGSVQFLPNGGAATSSTYSIAARSAFTLATAATDTNVHTGSVRVIPSFGQAPAGLAIFSFRNAGVTAAQAGVPAVPASSAFRLYAEESNEIETGFAVANTGLSPVNVTLELTTLDGVSTGSAGTVTVPANGQSAMFLNQVPAFANLPGTFKGLLRVSASGISVVGIRGRYNQRGDFLVTTIPAVDETIATSSADLVFPQFANGGGYTTQFVLFSGGPGQAASGSLRLVSPSGQPITLTLP